MLHTGFSKQIWARKLGCENVSSNVRIVILDKAGIGSFNNPL